MVWNCALSQWLGDKLTKERMEWYLEKMRSHTVGGLQINYAHGYEGGRFFGLTLKRDLLMFSDKWQELFKALSAKGKEAGLSVSLSDYKSGTAFGAGRYMDMEEKGEYTFIHLPLPGNELDLISFSRSWKVPPV